MPTLSVCLWGVMRRLTGCCLFPLCRKTSATCSSGLRLSWPPLRGSSMCNHWSLGGGGCVLHRLRLSVRDLPPSPVFQVGGGRLRGAPAPQGGAGVPQHPAMAQRAPPLQLHRAQRQHPPTAAPHQVLYYHLQVSPLRPRSSPLGFIYGSHCCRN